jgi:hypothetical protein
MRTMAFHVAASWKTRFRFVSTVSGSSPKSATLTDINGLPLAFATLSAVNVFPTPGGPALVINMERVHRQNDPYRKGE